MGKLSQRLAAITEQVEAIESNDLVDWRAKQFETWAKYCELRDAILGRGPMCRDCADEDRRCPHTRQLRDPHLAALEGVRVLKNQVYKTEGKADAD